MATLGLYGGTVTAGGTDGALLLTTNALKYTAEKGSLGDAVTYGLRCTTGARAYNVALSVTGTNPDWIDLSTDGSTWQATVTFDQIGDTNTLFYARANIPADASYSQTVLNSLALKYIETVGGE